MEIFTEICEFWISTKRKNRCVFSQLVRTWWRCGVRERREWQEKYLQSYVVPLIFVILCDWRGRHWILVNRIGGSGTDLRSKARVCPLDNAFYPKLVCFLGSWERESMRKHGYNLLSRGCVLKTWFAGSRSHDTPLLRAFRLKVLRGVVCYIVLLSWGKCLLISAKHTLHLQRTEMS